MTADPRLKLRELHAAAEQVSANLVELELDTSRQLLDASELRGESAARWSAAGAALTELWRRHGLLEALLERADKLHGSRGADELRSLLDGASIELATGDVPLAQRNLLVAPHTAERCSADELLASMSAAFDEVKLVVSSIGGAWDALIPKLDAARRALQECLRLADELGESGRIDVRSAQDRLAELGAAVTSDPLSVDVGEIDELTASLRRIASDLNDGIALKRGFDARMLDARGLLDQLTGAVRSAQAAHDEAVAKISVPAAPAPGEAPGDLADRLAEIAALAEAGSWREARQALEAWTARVRSLYDDARRTFEANRAPIEQRNQFRALLDAYQIKAKRLGRLEDAEVEAIFRQAHDVLYTAPTDLALAAQLVRRYQQALAGAPEVRR